MTEAHVSFSFVIAVVCSIALGAWIQSAMASARAASAKEQISDLRARVYDLERTRNSEDSGAKFHAIKTALVEVAGQLESLSEDLD